MAARKKKELTPERARQSAGLKSAEAMGIANTGLSRTQLAGALNMSYDQYMRYVNGTTALRVEQVHSFALAYRIPHTELARLIGLCDEVPGLREAIEQAIPESASQAREEAYRKLSSMAPQERADALEFMTEMPATRKRPSPRQYAVASEALFY